MTGSTGRTERTGPTVDASSEWNTARKRTTPPSTTSSYTTSAASSPAWGRAWGALSIFTTRAGRRCLSSLGCGRPVRKAAGGGAVVVVGLRVVVVVFLPPPPPQAGATSSRASARTTNRRRMETNMSEEAGAAGDGQLHPGVARRQLDGGARGVEVLGHSR